MLFLALPLMAQEQLRKSHVVDKETGETLPYTYVSVSNENRTITNYEGDFSITANDDDRIAVSCVGFETAEFVASKLPKVIRLVPLAKTMQTVQVVGWSRILQDVGKRMAKDYKKKKNRDSRYFLRMVNQFRGHELIEALVKAGSAVSVRDITFLRGRRGHMTNEGLSQPIIANMNFHHPFEVAPYMPEERFWQFMIRPFRTHPISDASDMKYTSDFYNIKGEVLTDNAGNKTYRIDVKRKPDQTKNRVVLSGTFYVDAKTMRPQRFEGTVDGMLVDIKEDFLTVTAEVRMAIHIDYTDRHGYAEVDNMVCEIESGDLRTRMLLFNVDGMKVSRIKGVKAQENMLASLDKAGNDEALWQKEEIVKRTAQEEAMAGQQDGIATSDSLLISEPLYKNQYDKQYKMLMARLKAFGERIPQEKVFLHMDNTSYFVGDTIWFAAYTRRTDVDLPSGVSGVLYVELLNHDGYLVERQTIELKDGRGHGNFVLGPDSYSGFYELRAYTRWQLNWGVNERDHSRFTRRWFLNTEFENLYFRDYDKLYSRVFPVYDAPKEKGVWSEVMTTRPMRRTFKNDPDQRTLCLSFYPEGGALVEGLESEVAFEAAWSDGEAVDGTLTIGDQQFVTANRGRGTFRFTPGKKAAKHGVFVLSDKASLTIDKDDRKVKADLPKAEKEGAVMHLSQQDSCWVMNIALSASLSADSLGFSIMHDGILQQCALLTDSITQSADTLQQPARIQHLNDGSIQVRLPHNLPAGVCQATLFGVSGRIWADRLFFVTTPDMTKPNLTISGVKDSYQPYEAIHLDVNSHLPGGTLSLAVRDGALHDQLFDNATMLTEMLLASEIKGFVPDPGWFFESRDEEHQRGLDLLMMTQGWRRFNWRHMAVRNTWEFTQPDERNPILTGRVYDVDETPFYGMEALRGGWASWDENRIRNWFDPTYLIDEGIEIDGALDNVKFHGNKELTTSSPTAQEKFNEIDYLNENSITQDFKEKLQNAKVFGRLKKEVVVHAEIVTASNTMMSPITTVTQDGRFRIRLPRIDEPYQLFLTAADTTGWTPKQFNEYVWVQAMPREEDLPAGHKKQFRIKAADKAVRVQFPFPRFVSAYNFYQRRLSDAFDKEMLSPGLLFNDGELLREVVVGGKRGMFRELNQSKPALVVDAADAYNQTLDAGMRHAEYDAVARTFLGSYGLASPYNHALRGVSSTWSQHEFDNPLNTEYRDTMNTGITVRYGLDLTRRVLAGATVNPDSAYIYKNLCSYDSDRLSYSTGKAMADYYYRSYQDRYVIYSDFCPRLYGSNRYDGSNLPKTEVAVFPYPDNSRRVTYRDRRYVMPGFSVADDFYHPNYQNRLPNSKPADYRRTLYWNPSLKLDAQGHASVNLWNNGKRTVISLSAEGTSQNGKVAVMQH